GPVGSPHRGPDVAIDGACLRPAAGGHGHVTVHGRDDRRPGKIGCFHVAVDIAAGGPDPGRPLDRKVHVDVVVAIGVVIAPAAAVASGGVPLVRVDCADDAAVGVLIHPDLHRGRVAAPGMLHGRDPHLPPAGAAGHDGAVDAPDFDGLAHGHGAGPVEVGVLR